MAQVMLRTGIFLSGGNDMIRGVKIVSIPVRNQDVALKFYTEKVGFKVATDQPFGPGQRWIELLIPGADTVLALFTPDPDFLLRAPSQQPRVRLSIRKAA
jgi:catechol 2,3-dioxygenase-like lactoylglutathione lyase family enzyme